jgi:uncharacterized protein with GYD domain
MRWTRKGIENVKESPARLDRAKDVFKAAGAEIKAFYLVNGRYDAVVIAEAPNDEVIAKLVLAIGSQGNIRSETVHAFTEEEYRKIIAGLP